jgi:hypothetical protein
MYSYQKLKNLKNLTLLFIISIILMFTTTILYFGLQDKKDNINEEIKLKKTQLELIFTKKIYELKDK